jgi:hypothetical protein
LELRCTPGRIQDRLVDDIVVGRSLSAEEVEVLGKLVVASDLYSGGHVGHGGMNVLERLEVRQCCGRLESVVLITLNNPTFSQGARQALVALLKVWYKPLMTQAAQLRNETLNQEANASS